MDLSWEPPGFGVGLRRFWIFVAFAFGWAPLPVFSCFFIFVFSDPAMKWKSLSSLPCLTLFTTCQLGWGLCSALITRASTLLHPKLSPSDLRLHCCKLPFSRAFLPWVRRVSPVPIQPFLTCHRQYPAGIGARCQSEFQNRCSLRQ